MAEVYETKKLTERVVLVGVAFQEGDDTVSSLDELAELAATAGAVTVGRIDSEPGGCLIRELISARARLKS